MEEQGVVEMVKEIGEGVRHCGWAEVVEDMRQGVKGRGCEGGRAGGKGGGEGDGGVDVKMRVVE